MSDEDQAPETIAVKVPPVMPVNVRQAEHEVQQWLVYVPSTVTKENLEDPAYWSFVASRFRAPARLTIMAEDGTWMMDAMVMIAESNWAKIHLLGIFWFGADTPVADDPDLEVKWGAPANKWMVVRKSDKEVLVKGQESKEMAQLWLREHRKAIAR